MSKIREIDVIRMSKINVLDGVTETTTVRELYEKVSVLAERWEEEEKKRKEAEKIRLKEQGQEVKEKKDLHTPTFLAEHAKPLLVSCDHSIVIFESGDVYYKNEIGETVVKLGRCCKKFLSSPDYDGNLDPKQLSYGERKMSTFSAELVQELSWPLAITLVADDRCRANSNNRKGDRNRTDNVVISDEGEEMDFFDSYYDSRTYYGIGDMVIDQMEAERLHDVACAGVNKKAVKILDRTIDDVPQELIAAEIGTKVNSVKSTLCRERKKMRQNILEDGTGDMPNKK